MTPRRRGAIFSPHFFSALPWRRVECALPPRLLARRRDRVRRFLERLAAALRRYG